MLTPQGGVKWIAYPPNANPEPPPLARDSAALELLAKLLALRSPLPIAGGPDQHHRTIVWPSQAYCRSPGYNYKGLLCCIQGLILGDSLDKPFRPDF